MAWLPFQKQDQSKTCFKIAVRTGLQTRVFVFIVVKKDVMFILAKKEKRKKKRKKKRKNLKI